MIGELAYGKRTVMYGNVKKPFKNRVLGNLYMCITMSSMCGIVGISTDFCPIIYNRLHTA